MITEKCTLFIIRIIELEIDTDITKRISQPHTVAAVRKIIRNEHVDVFSTKKCWL